MKRLIALILAALLLSASGVAYAETATARVMRLEEREGTVALKKSSGVSLSITDGMKLYNGYKLSTGASSCAYVSLDSSKAVKLGSSAAASVKKNGTKLELLLTSGKLYFNVSLPVASDESLKIRTSTTVTGIRGTAGEVRVQGGDMTEILLFTGEVAVLASDPSTGEMRETIVRAGELATAAVHAEGESEGTLITVRPLKETDIDGFAALEIAKDEALQKKMEDETELDVRAIVDGAEERLDADNAREKDAIAELGENESRRDEQMFEEPVYYFGPSVVTLNASNFVPGSPAYEDSGGVIAASLNTYDIVNIAMGAGETVGTMAPLTVPAGKTLNIVSGTLFDEYGITVDGSLVVAAGAALESAASITNNSGNSITNNGTINIQSGVFNNTANGAMVNNGTINNRGALTNAGTLTNNGEMQIITGSFTNTGTVNNTGSVTRYAGGTVTQGTNWVGFIPVEKVG